jgi:hypothetical protein
MSTIDAEQSTVSGADLAMFTRQLGAMLHAGVNVLRALRIASQYTGNGVLIEAARSLAGSLEDGKELHEALARHPELFDPFYVEMARQGEADGTLGQALLGVADYLDHLTLLGSTHPEREAAAVPAAPSVPVGRPLTTTLGLLALGVAVIGGLVALGILDSQWYLPLACGWAGYCFLSSGQPASAPVVPLASRPVTPPAPPRKSAQRRAAETEGMVRSALHEQEEELEARAATGREPEGSPNGRAGLGADVLLPPDERQPPRFDL